jgi:hypothetical protein
MWKSDFWIYEMLYTTFTAQTRPTKTKNKTDECYNKNAEK